jgi:hypothetical protein
LIRRSFFRKLLHKLFSGNEPLLNQELRQCVSGRYRDGEPVFSTPKTKHSIRKIRIPGELCLTLKKWKLQCPPSKWDLVFPKPDGRPQDRKATWRAFDTAIKKANENTREDQKLKRLTVHSLRHSFASTSTIPIVMANDNDPAGNGFVASLARPGGNITGLSTLYPEISGKRLELLKEIIPKLSHVAVFGTSTQPGNAQLLREVELAAGAFGVKFQIPRGSRSQGY